ncbi:hypothetical protein L596_001106 [Steinernema carpocapsae]|nr:hypothetical protein L596_001106 [Steinernema carpocapsae]
MGGAASSLFHRHHAEPSRVVEVKNGKIQGKTYKVAEKTTVDCFLGVPFGKPPVGELRFKKPVPADSWDGVLDCTKFGPRCPHKDEIFDHFPFQSLPSKDEDCLRLNIFAPTGDQCEAEDKAAGGRPVLIFVHGGGYAVHSSAHYGDVGIASTICKKGVIVVSVQYRLGFLGFLSTDDEVCRGNFGLYDQTLALKWVKDNIGQFGGNSENITLCGQSAGGASVDLLSLSPVSRDLFQKVIPMGGNAMCNFATNTAEHVRNECLRFAQEKGFKPDFNSSRLEQSKAMLEFYKHISHHDLQIGLFGIRGHRINKRKLDLTPVFGDEFLPKSIHELRKEAPKKTCMVGAAEYEGLLFAALTFSKPTVAHIERGIRRAFLLNHNDKNEEVDKVVAELLSFYVPEKKKRDHKHLAFAVARVMGDSLVTYGQPTYVKEMTQNGHRVYFYSFDYARSARFGIIHKFLPFTAATHGTEMPYLLGKGVIANFHPDEEDHKMVDKFTSIFANFCRYGDPNGKPGQEQTWEEASAENPHRYYSINLPESGMKDNYQDKTSIMWNEAFAKMGTSARPFKAEAHL